jgi:hypothetical protein
MPRWDVATVSLKEAPQVPATMLLRAGPLQLIADIASDQQFFHMSVRKPSQDDPLRVVVSDAREMDCKLLAEAIARSNRLRVVGRATSSAELISMIKETKADAVVISARLKDGATAGMSALRELRESYFRSSIIMLLDEELPELCRRGVSQRCQGGFLPHRRIVEPAQVHTIGLRWSDLGERRSDGIHRRCTDEGIGAHAARRRCNGEIEQARRRNCTAGDRRHVESRNR